MLDGRKGRTAFANQSLAAFDDSHTSMTRQPPPILWPMCMMNPGAFLMVSPRAAIDCSYPSVVWPGTSPVTTTVIQLDPAPNARMRVITLLPNRRFWGVHPHSFPLGFPV